MMQSTDFQIHPFPTSRKSVVDGGYLANKRHIIHGLLEVDVTSAKAFIRDYKAKTGETLSFTAYLVNCLAQAVKSHPQVQAYRGWRGHLVIFDAVDVVTLIEAEKNAVAIPHIIRNADQKSFYAIHEEIRTIQHKKANSPQSSKKEKWVFKIPRFLRLRLMSIALKNPHSMKKRAGTVVITSVGMFGNGHGFGIGFLAMHTMGITVGGMFQRPVLCDGVWVNRDMMCITLSFDHDVVDGAPATRFATDFVALLESGFGLDVA
ncbi:MAG: 2-oxo acid dehydrogenase subunit E2 [bacterium]|nr:2-oxo acid dehydrogenase subunit E2 [bacterium]